MKADLCDKRIYSSYSPCRIDCGAEHLFCAALIAAAREFPRGTVRIGIRLFYIIKRNLH